MSAPTKTQLMIGQELVRRGCERRPTRQDEYLKFADGGGNTIWVGRRGEIRTGRRLPEGHVCRDVEWQGLKRSAKKNYRKD